MIATRPRRRAPWACRDTPAHRALIFHESYLHEQGKMQDEVYLLERCKDSEFYSNIRQHTDICTQVLENSRSSVLLKVSPRPLAHGTARLQGPIRAPWCALAGTERRARCCTCALSPCMEPGQALNTMALNTHMCGLSPCMDFVQGIATRIGWQFFIGLGLLMLVFPNIAFAVYRLSRQAYPPCPRRRNGCIRCAPYCPQALPLEDTPLSVPDSPPLVARAGAHRGRADTRTRAGASQTGPGTTGRGQ